MNFEFSIQFVVVVVVVVLFNCRIGLHTISLFFINQPPNLNTLEFEFKFEFELAIEIEIEIEKLPIVFTFNH